MNTFIILAALVSAIASQPERQGGIENNLDRSEAVLSSYARQIPSTQADAPWACMHRMLVGGADTPVYTSSGMISTLSWLQRCRVRKSPFLQCDVTSAVPHTDNYSQFVVQDHHNQFLAIMAQAGVGGDMYRSAASTPWCKEEVCATWEMLLRGSWGKAYNPDQELSWTLIVYTYYYNELPASDVAKRNRLEQVIRLVLLRDCEGGACGGAHAYCALAHYFKSPLRLLLLPELNKAVKQRLDSAACNNRENLRAVAMRYKSTTSVGLDRADALYAVINRVGHYLEWAVVYCDQKDLRESRMLYLVSVLCDALEDCRRFRWEGKDIGAMMHALRAVKLFRQSLMAPVSR